MLIIIVEINVKEVLNLLNIQHKDKGNYYNAHCPNPGHRDKNPSWNIDKRIGVHNCLSCGYKGNLKTLIHDLTGQTLQDFLNIKDLSSYHFQQASTSRQNIVKESSEIKILGDFYEPYDNQQVMDYLRERRIKEDFIRYYNLVYCTHVSINGTDFYNRICVPIFENNQLISIEGRDFTKKQKPKVLYPKDSKVSTLFDIDRLDRGNPLYVVEGIMDLVPLFNLGYRNITCTFGSAVSKYQKEVVKEFERDGCYNIILIPDGDEAGRRFIDTFENSLDYDYYIVILPEGKDPGKCSKREIFNLLEKKIRGIDYLVDKKHPEIKFRQKSDNWVF